MRRLRSTLVTAAAIAAAAVSGAAIASAATSSTPTPSGRIGPHHRSAAGAPHDPSKGGHTVNGKTEKLLTGDVAAKVRAAALAKVPGTVERVETNVDSSAPTRRTSASPTAPRSRSRWAATSR